MNIYEKLLKVQNELKVPKNHFNKFGGYNYRNAEDILEGLKPLLEKNGLVLLISDSIIEVLNRVYVRSTGLLVDVEKPESRMECYALAREPESKKGMDEAQITGATSSYARKYMLNGLFGIDDSKDADSMEPPKPTQTEVEKVKQEISKLTDAERVRSYFGKHVQPRFNGDDLKSITDHCTKRVKEIEVRNDNNK